MPERIIALLAAASFAGLRLPRMPIQALENLNAGICRQEAMNLFLSACNDTMCDVPHGSFWVTESWWRDNGPELFSLLHDPITAEEAGMLRAIVRRECRWKSAVECLARKLPWADFYAERLKMAAAAVTFGRTMQFDYAQRDLWWHVELPRLNEQPPQPTPDVENDSEERVIADVERWIEERRPLRDIERWVEERLHLKDYSYDSGSSAAHFDFLRRVRLNAQERRARTRQCRICGSGVRAKMVELVSATDGASAWRGWLVTCQNCKRVVEGPPEDEESDIVLKAAWRFDLSYHALKRELGEPADGEK